MTVIVGEGQETIELKERIGTLEAANLKLREEKRKLQEDYDIVYEDYSVLEKENEDLRREKLAPKKKKENDEKVDENFQLFDDANEKENHFHNGDDYVPARKIIKLADPPKKQATPQKKQIDPPKKNVNKARTSWIDTSSLAAKTPQPKPIKKLKLPSNFASQKMSIDDIVEESFAIENMGSQFQLEPENAFSRDVEFENALEFANSKHLASQAAKDHNSSRQAGEVLALCHDALDQAPAYEFILRAPQPKKSKASGGITSMMFQVAVLIDDDGQVVPFLPDKSERFGSNPSSFKCLVRNLMGKNRSSYFHAFFTISRSASKQ